MCSCASVTELFCEERTWLHFFFRRRRLPSEFPASLMVAASMRLPRVSALLNTSSDCVVKGLKEREKRDPALLCASAE